MLTCPNKCSSQFCVLFSLQQHTTVDVIVTNITTLLATLLMWYLPCWSRPKTFRIWPHLVCTRDDFRPAKNEYFQLLNNGYPNTGCIRITALLGAQICPAIQIYLPKNKLCFGHAWPIIHRTSITRHQKSGICCLVFRCTSNSGLLDAIFNDCVILFILEQSLGYRSSSYRFHTSLLHKLER